MLLNTYICRYKTHQRHLLVCNTLTKIFSYNFKWTLRPRNSIGNQLRMANFVWFLHDFWFETMVSNIFENRSKVSLHQSTDVHSSLMAHMCNILIPNSNLLIPKSSVLTTKSGLLTPKGSLLTANSSLLTHESRLPTPKSDLLIHKKLRAVYWPIIIV